MSTDYHFRCMACDAFGGSFTRQAWGVGNADLILTFKFVMWHAINCGHKYIRLESEHTDDRVLSKEELIALIEGTADIFPRSEDWTFMADNTGHSSIDSINEIWTRHAIEQAEREGE